MDQKNNRNKRDPHVALAAGLGTQFAVAVGLCSFGGYKLDMHYGTKPWYLLGGILLAMIYGIYEVWKLLRKMKK